MKTLTSLMAVLTLAGAAAPAYAQATQPRVQVLAGQATLFQAPGILERVAVSNPKLANVRVLPSGQVLIQGITPGTATLMIWTKGRSPQAFQLVVDLDIPQIQKTVRDATGNGSLRVGYNGQAFLLSGNASNQALKDVAEKVMNSFGSPVVNLVQIPQAEDQVAINVQVIELSRSSALNLGVTLGGGEVTEIMGGLRKYVFKPGEVMFGEQTTGVPASMSQIDFLALKLDAMQKRGEAKVLASPTLVTMDGGTAKFLAGGEIPIPVQQALGTTTIMWKEFGVRLEIKPRVMSSGRIQLAVAPEVSSLDFANGLKQATFTVPAIKTRRAETQVMLAPQETLMLGGLMNNEDSRAWMGLPGLIDIPILGELFKSRSFQQNRTELAILVTPRLVKSEPQPTLPGHLPEVHRDLGEGMKK